MRLILSSAELALLPFELMDSPRGLPGTGLPLLLQSQTPFCLTREVRRVTSSPEKWPETPRILFAASDSRGSIPLPAHVLALRQAIDPWIPKHLEGEDLDKRVSQYLKILPNASLEEIRAECAREEYTHVHFLAHGGSYQDERDERYGLCLHSADKRDGEIVSGNQLALALRACARHDTQRLSRPMVVTLAVCNAGNTGGVIGSGGSIAHTLHECDIPVVIASQFPLTFAGSIVMVERLYSGLLQGEDPRICLMDLRRRLKAMPAREVGHDWSSLVAYANLPTQLDSQLLDVKVLAKRNAVSALFESVSAWDDIYKPESGRAKQNPPGIPLQKTPSKEAIQSQRKELERIYTELLHLVRASLSPDQRVWIHGLIAGSKKREAYLLYRSINPSPGQTTPDDGNTATWPDIRASLMEAWRHYRISYEAQPTTAWPLVQHLALSMLLDIGIPGSTLGMTWIQAHTLLKFPDFETDAGKAVYPGDPVKKKAGHLSDAIELYLLSHFFSNDKAVQAVLETESCPVPPEEVGQGREFDLARQMNELLLRDDRAQIIHQTTIRQLRLYAHAFPWMYKHLHVPRTGTVDYTASFVTLQSVARELLDILDPTQKNAADTNA